MHGEEARERLADPLCSNAMLVMQHTKALIVFGPTTSCQLRTQRSLRVLRDSSNGSSTEMVRARVHNGRALRAEAELAQLACAQDGGDLISAAVLL